MLELLPLKVIISFKGLTSPGGMQVSPTKWITAISVLIIKHKKLFITY